MGTSPAHVISEVSGPFGAAHRLPCNRAPLQTVPDLRQFRATPNVLTMLRLFTLPFLVIEILDGHWRLAFLLLWIAGISDGLDGLLARKLGQHTRLGQYLDPIADKALLSTLFLVLTHVGVIPRYVTVLVFSRDLGILIISTLLYITNILRDFRPSWLGKASTTVQILAVLTVMTVQLAPHAGGLHSGLDEVKYLLLRVVAVLAPLSAAQYAWTTLRKIQTHASEPVLGDHPAL